MVCENTDKEKTKMKGKAFAAAMLAAMALFALTACGKTQSPAAPVSYTHLTLPTICSV